MNKITFTSIAIVLSLLLLSGGKLQAQMFDADVSAIEKSHAEGRNNRLPADFFDDPDNVDRFLEQFHGKGERIVGGETVDIADYPWQASLQTTTGAHFCGAVLVDANWAITAAHCLVFNGDEVNPDNIRLRVGFTALSSAEGSTHTIDDLFVYPDYDDDDFQYDIALLKLSQPLNLADENVATVGRVTQRDADQGMTDPGEMAKVSGWGRLSYGGTSPDSLQAIEVPIVDVNETNYSPAQITDDMIIAGADNMDSCQGDSGGPMVVKDGVGWYKVAGIVSFGVECGLPGYPGVYARVSFFEDWLDQYLVDPDPNQFTTLHHESFGDGDIPEGWTNEVIEGPVNFPGWEWTNTGGEWGGQLNSTTADDGYMILNSDAHGASGISEEADLISKSFDFTDITSNLLFSVEHWARTFGNADVRIYISTDDFETQTALYRWYDAPQNNTNGPNPVISEFDITDIAQGEPNVRIKFKWIGSYDYWWLLDDFKLQTENPEKQVHFVVTDGEEPIEDVFITTQYTDQEAMTDAAGEASLTLYEGSYDLSASKADFFLYEETIEVTADGQVVHIEMEKIPVPQIVIDTNEIEFSLPQGTIGSIPVNIANPGDLELEYALFTQPVQKDDKTAPGTHETAHYPGYGDEPGGSLSSKSITMAPGAADSEAKEENRDTGTVVIHHDNGPSTAIGNEDESLSFIAATRFTAEDLAAFYGVYELSAAKFHISSDAFSEIQVKVWEGGSISGPGTEVYTSDVTEDILIGQWNTFVFDEAISLSEGEEYWIGYAIVTEPGHPASTDGGPMVADKGGWIYINNQWMQLTTANPNLDYNWNIRGVLHIAEDIDWLSFDPQSGVVAPGSNMDVDFIFSAEDLDMDTYEAQVIVQNNAGENIHIPVSYTVTPPEYDVTFEITDPEGNDIDDAAISLAGFTNDPGNYEFPDVPAGLHDYEVSKTGYQTATGQIHVVDEDLVVEVILLEDDADTVALHIQIEDEFEDPVEDAYVHIQGFGFKLSDANGNTTFNVIPGTYDFTVSKEGFEDLTDEVVVTSDSEQFLDVILTYLRFDVTIDINLDEAGEVEGAEEYHYGQTATIKATPNTGYHFVHWLEDGVEVTTEEEYSFVVKEDRSFLAIFDLNTYIITSSFTGNGGIEPFGEVEVTHGEDMTFQVAPAPGNHIVDVEVNEESVGPVEEYTFENVMEDNQTIHAVFDISKYDVEISIEGNGTAEPDGTVEVPHGESLLIAFTPDEDHHISDVLVNEQSVGAFEEYLLANVTQHTTVHAIFEFSVDIDDVDLLPGLAIFPNPAVDHVTVSGTEIIREIRLYDLTGQALKTVKPEINEYNLNISQLDRGIYLIQVRFPKVVKTVSLKVE